MAGSAPEAVLVGLGAIPGAWLRLKVVNHFQPMVPKKHWGTFLVNVVACFALGLVLALVVHPGAGMNIDPSNLDASSLSGYMANAGKVKETGFADFIMKLIPATAVSAFTSGDVLQVLLISVTFGCALLLSCPIP